MKISYNIYKVIRSILVTAIVTVIGVYVILYLVLSLPVVQNKIKGVGEKELEALLHTKVSIGELQIAPFNQLVLYDVSVLDQKNDSLLSVDKLGAGLSIYNLLVKQRLVFTYAEIIGLNGKVSKQTKESPTNIQFIIDALSPKTKNKPPTKFDIQIYNIVIRKSNLSYDVWSEAPKMGRFDKNHIKLTDIRADIALPELKNDDFVINVKRLSLKENNGLSLKNLSLNSIIKKQSIELKNIQIELPNTVITPEDISLKFNDLKTIGEEIKSIPMKLNIANCYVTLSDFAGLEPALSKFPDAMNITLALRGTLKDLSIPVLSVTTANKRITVGLNGRVNNLDNVKELYFDIPHFDINAKSDEITKITSNFANLSENVSMIIRNSGNVRIDGSIKGNLDKVGFNGVVATSVGSVTLNGDLAQNNDRAVRYFKGTVSASNFNVGSLISKPDLIGSTTFDVKLDAKLSKTDVNGNVAGNIKYIDLKGHRYNDITANITAEKNKYSGNVTINDTDGRLSVEGIAENAGAKSNIDVQIIAHDINLANLNLYNKNPQNNLTFGLDASFEGDNIDNATGNIVLHDFKYCDASDKGVHIDHLIIDADNRTEQQSIRLSSDILNGDVTGSYDIRRVVSTIKNMLAQAFPTFISPTEHGAKQQKLNNFIYNLNIQTNDEIAEFFHLPIRLLSPVTINGDVNETENSCKLDINAPYIQQNNKLIEGTRLTVGIDGEEDNVSLMAHTIISMKKGKLELNVDANGVNDRIDTNVAWQMAREHEYSGSVNLSTLLKYDEEKKICADVDVNPTQLVFNDTAWQVHPAKVMVERKRIDVKGFMATCDKQFVKINGIVSRNAEDNLCVELNDINLDYVFETLNISNVMFGGRATGKFYASDLYSKVPRLSTPNLHVDDLAYNSAVLGDTDIKSTWNNEEKAVTIDASVKQSNGCESEISGKIFPTMDSLYFDFNANKINIAFLKPFMSAISSDIQGEASGHACLYGNFHRIDLLGDIYANNLKMKVDYTNVYYTTSDSVKIRSGLLTFKNVTLRDKNGHTAKLNGKVTHKYFHDAAFNFSITDARDFLCYDITPQINPDWYGTIYGNGSAFINGEPGVVNIDVNMATAANSKFSFVLSDTESATEYNFITFTDKRKIIQKEKEEVSDTRPLKVRGFEKRQANIEEVGRSLFKINLMVEVTPLAQMILVMDPVGGDRIKATGNGNLRLTYNNADDEMMMLGNYTIEKGSYNFTLQDIIIRDFSIKEGSSISFKGDPLAANLDIAAIYSVNANLRDLDESFATDKDMNRTNVPVQALLNVKGDIKEPIISFDLGFPTLTSDAYRKVKSIISTDDMMNRQIIYLLALNRFYTPEYTGAVNKNNGLASVASSTISSQLGSMLGQLSENWSISPNFRSDKGDFSDLEVELALSSQLLNNRLLFNGNFGYRDNTMNTRNSNFIGDFDIEYLLTKNGNFRLKAYNHYNDQNYYVKSALTTQGVGIVLKHDFNGLSDIFKKKSIFSRKPDSIKTENIKTIPADTIDK